VPLEEVFAYLSDARNNSQWDSGLKEETMLSSTFWTQGRFLV